MRFVHFVFAAAAIAASAAHADPTVFTVTNTNVSGAGSLANILAGLDPDIGACPADGVRIEFGIPAATDPGCNGGTGICKVQMPDDFAIRCSNTAIDGYTQAGASPNTATGLTNNAQLRIELDSSGPGDPKYLRTQGPYNGFGSNGVTNVTIRGLALPRHSLELNAGNTGSVPHGGSGRLVAGNWLGWHADGTRATGIVSRGISLAGAFLSNVTIGGGTPADRNLITYRDASLCCEYGAFGITGQGVSDVLIEGNYFNVTPAGARVPSGNGIGFAIQLSSNGNTPYSRNAIIRNNVIYNTVGAPMALGMGQGMTISRNVVAGQALGQQAWGWFTVPAGGVRNEDKPVLTGTVELPGELQVFGTVTNAANATMRLEFFHNTQGGFQGGTQAERFVSEMDIVLDASGNATFIASLPPDTRHVSVSSTNLATGETGFLAGSDNSPALARLFVTNGNVVTFDTTGVACPATPPLACRAYSPGTTAVVIAQSAGFTGWTGGCALPSSTTCNIVMNGDKTLTANYGVSFVVTPSAGPNGSISPNTPLSIAQGQATSFTVTANAGFTASVGGTCGGSLVGNLYTTNPVSQDCTVEATFTPGLRFVITTTAETGPGSFGAALADLFANCGGGSNRIDFNIPAATDPGCNAGTGICKVAIADQALIRCGNTLIDGYSQPGASPNTATDLTNNAQIRIELDNAGPDTNKVIQTRGTDHPFGSNPVFNVTLRGLALPHHMIELRGGNSGSVEGGGGGHVVAGNWLGWHADGTRATGVASRGLYFHGAYLSGVTIGGPNPADRNLFTSVDAPSGVNAIYAAGAENALVEGNFVNVAPDGTPVPLSNGVSTGILFMSNGNTPYPRDSIVRNNVIRNIANGFPTNISVEHGVTISRNLISGQPPHVRSLAIGFVGTGVTQAAPVITGVTETPTEVLVFGSVQAPANRIVRLEFFHNSVPYSANGAHAESFAGELDVNVGPGGSSDFIAHLPATTRNVAVSATDLTTGETSQLNQGTPPASLARLTVTNGGAVVFDTSGVVCPATPPAACRAYGVGMTVVLTAQGAGFTGWTGGCVSPTNPQCNIVMDADKTLTANYGTTFAVTPSAGPNGSISPSTVQNVAQGAAAVFTVTANAGFIASVGGTCGGSLNGDVYTTNPVNQACTVVASFTAGALYVITSTAETGAGTLTAALTHLNANCGAGTKRIEFNIPAATDPGCNAGTGVCVVQLEFFNGHNISCPNVLVDGYTQPGASPNTSTGLSSNAQLKIELAGTTNFVVGNDNVTMRGIAFASVGVEVTLHQPPGSGPVSTVNPVFTGNYFGWRADGLTPVGGNNGARISLNNGQSTNVTGARVGGPNPADRNLITYAGFGDGIGLNGVSGSLIEANLFNLDRNGNPVAGASTVNAISSNVGGNSANVIRRNVITRTKESGFTCAGGNGTTLTENEIYDINSTAQAHPRGIRMEPGCNHDQAAPVLTNVTLGTTVDVQGTLTSVANETFRVELFHNSTPDTALLGLGEEVAGHVDVATNGAGSAVFSTSLPGFARNITATATRLSNGDTSTFSAVGVPTGPFFTLTVVKSGTGSGTVTSSPGAIDCGATCAASFGQGADVTLTAAPAGDALFGGWTGACTGAGLMCTVTINAAATVTATFTALVKLTVTNGGAVVFDTSGVVCPATPPAACRAYGVGMTVVLTAQGAGFTGWSGGCVSPTNPQCNIVMDADKTLTANYAIPQRTLSVTRTGTGTGFVVSTPSGLDCHDNACVASFPDGSSVRLDAGIDGNSVFAGWSGSGCTGTGPCTVIMSANRIVNAQFNPILRTLSVAVSGSGSVSSSPVGIACGATCSAEFSSGTVVTLTPTAIGGATFSSWSGACTGTGACLVIMDAAKSVTANFTPAPTFNLSVTTSGSGTVTSNPGGIGCGATCASAFAAGTTVTLTATPTPPYMAFTGWSGACSGTAPSCTVAMTASRSVTANFAPKTVTVTVVKAGNGSGTVSGSGINCGATCQVQVPASAAGFTLDETPAEGSVFSHWTGGTCQLSTARRCVPDLQQDTTITATFEKLVKLTVTLNTHASVSSTPRGLVCTTPQSGSAPTVCTGIFQPFQTVRITGHPADRLLSFSGDCTSHIEYCDFGMGSVDRDVSATFSDERLPVILDKGTGAAVITVSNAGGEFHRCEADRQSCQQTFLRDDPLVFSAQPVAGNALLAWRVFGTTGADYASVNCAAIQEECKLSLSLERTHPSIPNGVVPTVQAVLVKLPATITGIATSTAPALTRTTRVGAAFSPAPSVLLRNADGNPVRGANVFFQVIAGPNGASGTSAPNRVSLNNNTFTGADGVATVPMYANSVVGAWTLRVTADPDLGLLPLDIAMNNTNDTLPVTLPGHGGVATIPTTSATGVRLTVLVRRLGQPVSGATVRFSTTTSTDLQGHPIASGTATPASVLSDLRGYASTMFRSNGLPGTFTVTVRVTFPTSPLGAAAKGFEGDDYVTELTVQAVDNLPDAVVTDPMGDYDNDGIPNAVEDAEGTLPFDRDNDVFADPRLFAMQQYRDFLGREGDAGGVQFWAGRVDAGMARSQVIESFFDSPEFQGTIAPVARLYFAYFLRIPDYNGLNFWIGYYRAGNSLESISQQFASSQEFQDRYGALDNAGFVNLVYQNVLARAPDAAGLAFWKGELDAGRRSRGQVMLEFSESPEYRSLIGAEVYVTMAYSGMLRRAPDAGGFSFWVQYIDAGKGGLALIDGFLGSQEYRGRFLP